ncbi:MAG: riboflavin synthase [Alphaproteobacteria bacterium CG11_big_fil_rev_8_21_14_0_20_44_7]|nr:MAG: riboflavin synthase [Alphaproteobacteria bacterium CG11_big_fil_rev_8_21_14_0_20_44_7]
MFTGIITDVGHVIAASKRGEAMFKISTDFDRHDIAIGASISCSGVCLTVIDTGGFEGKDWFMAQASEETLSCTTLKNWIIGTKVNLERALKVGDELGGHFVTGHIDAIAKVLNFQPIKGSMTYEIETPKGLERFIARKGSVTLDGVSLTVNDITSSSFFINIIPHTQKYTTLGDIQIGERLNLEIDPIARYVERYNMSSAENLKLIEHG